MTQLKKSLPTDVLIAGPPIQGGLDCLAALRGMEQMMIDIMEDPDTVKQKLKEINTAIIDVRNALWEAQEGAVQGGINRFGMYSDTFTDVPQCDASCMINNEMFEIFQVPALKKEISLLQNAVYHLDGPGALQHRNSLYKMDTLAMIQWQPGYGNYEKDWRWLYDEIDQKGKGQVIQSFVKMDRNEMINFWKESSSKNIVFIIEPDQIEGIDSFAAELESAGR
jgi:rhodanese-related sulfurtransferase